MDIEIRKLYEIIVSAEDFKQDSIDEELRKEIKEFLKEHYVNQNNANVESVAFSLAEIGEEAGFVRGFKYAFRLLSECVENKSVI